MDFDKLDPDFITRMGSYTSRVYRDLYPSIDPTSPKLSQKGKVILISGAGGGIGSRGIVPAFAKARARAIILVGRSRDKLEQTANAIGKIDAAIEILAIPTDISDSIAVDSLFAEIKTKYGHADVLVNNAGILINDGPIQHSDMTKWWAEFEINVHGTYLVTRGFLQLLGSDKRGSIVNVSSGAATNVVPGMSSYSISKLAVNQLTEYIAAENPNIQCVTLDPGMVDTEMVIGALLPGCLTFLRC
jgi:NAD(P)-dependent dehydrogenase (short-subunit alcohol dehydrogenase family)